MAVDRLSMRFYSSLHPRGPHVQGIQFYLGNPGLKDHGEASYRAMVLRALFAIERTAYQLGWTDGLPWCRPQCERLHQFLELRRPSISRGCTGRFRSRRRDITVVKVAANAVMAGCLPEYLPVVLAAVEAMLDPVFNLVVSASSMGGAAVLAMQSTALDRYNSLAFTPGITCSGRATGPTPR